MKALDCEGHGDLFLSEPGQRPTIWTCNLCLRRVCTACEGTHCGVAAVDDVCDVCWEGVCSMVAVLVANRLAQLARRHR